MWRANTGHHHPGSTKQTAIVLEDSPAPQSIAEPPVDDDDSSDFIEDDDAGFDDKGSYRGDSPDTPSETTENSIVDEDLVDTDSDEDVPRSKTLPQRSAKPRGFKEFFPKPGDGVSGWRNGRFVRDDERNTDRDYNAVTFDDTDMIGDDEYEETGCVEQAPDVQRGESHVNVSRKDTDEPRIKLEPAYQILTTHSERVATSKRRCIVKALRSPPSHLRKCMVNEHLPTSGNQVLAEDSQNGTQRKLRQSSLTVRFNQTLQKQQDLTPEARDEERLALSRMKRKRHIETRTDAVERWSPHAEDSASDLRARIAANAERLRQAAFQRISRSSHPSEALADPKEELNEWPTGSLPKPPESSTS